MERRPRRLMRRLFGNHAPGMGSCGKPILMRASPTKIVRRSIVVAGLKLLVSLEAEFWRALTEIAAREALTLPELIGRIHAGGEWSNLSSGIRAFVLHDYRQRAGQLHHAE